MAGTYTDVTDETFTGEVLKSSEPVVVDFWAPWCVPCLRMAPTYEAVAGEYSGRVKFTKLNTEDHPMVPMKMQIQAIPTMVLFKDGVEVDRIVGMVNREMLKRRVDEAFGVTA